MTEEQQTQMEAQPVMNQGRDLTHIEQITLKNQRALSSLPPGSPQFRELKKTLRAGRIYRQHMAAWPAIATRRGRG